MVIENHLLSALVCSARLLNLAGLHPISIEKFRNSCLFNDEDRVTQEQLKRHLNQFGKLSSAKFHLRSLTLDKLKPQHLPLAFRDKTGQFVILAGINQQQALLQYSNTQKPEIINRSELDNLWGGLCLFCKQSRFDIRWFIPVFLRHRRQLTQVLLVSLMLQLLALVAPLFFQVVMDKVLVHNALATLDVLVITLVVVGVFEVVLKSLREYLFAHTTTRVDIQLGGKLFHHLIHLPLSYFKQRHVGNIVARVRELDSIREFITGSALTLSVDVVFSVVLFTVMWFISPYLTLIALASLPCFVVLAFMTTKPLQKKVETLACCAAQNGSFLTETVAGVETLKSLALEPRMQHRWEEQTCDFAKANFAVQNVQNFSTQTAQLLQKLTTTSVIVFGAYEVMGIHLSIGQLIAFHMLLVQAMLPMTKLVDLWQQSIRAQVGLSLLADILTLPMENSGSGFKPEKPLEGAISLHKVIFRYRPDLPPVLRELTLRISSGEHIGLVGPSGSGKSTIARLIQRLYTAEQGEILIDGKNVNQFDAHALRRQVGVVMQENYLFNRTVRENIAHAFPTAPLEQVVKAACLAGADEFILALPLGYDTVLSEGGSSLSGGQRQRIAIARALLSDPKILIFDEATSALDDDSQSQIMKNMAEIVASRTVITIAHRLSTVRHCDRIAVIEGGVLTELASHDELLAFKGSYYRLWQQQINFSTEEMK